jgi:hypothetical protein
MKMTKELEEKFNELMKKENFVCVITEDSLMRRVFTAGCEAVLKLPCKGCGENTVPACQNCGRDETLAELVCPPKVERLDGMVFDEWQFSIKRNK